MCTLNLTDMIYGRGGGEVRIGVELSPFKLLFSSSKVPSLAWQSLYIRLMFYLTTHSTHFIYGYMASDMVKDHSDSEKGNPLQPHRLLFPINSKGYFICTITQTG